MCSFLLRCNWALNKLDNFENELNTCAIPSILLKSGKRANLRICDIVERHTLHHIQTNIYMHSLFVFRECVKD